jgi:integrase
MGRKRKVRKELPKRVYFNHGAYYLVTLKGKWIRLDSNFAKAMTKWAELVMEPNRMNKMGEVMDRYMREVAPLKAESTYEGNLHQIKPLKIFFGELAPNKIKPINIYSYLDIRKDTPPAANREKALFSAIFQKAIEWGITETNPCRVVKNLKEKKRDRYITDAEFNKLYNEASPFIKCVLDIGYITAQRISDILKITKSDIRDDGLYLEQGKTGKKLVFELTPELQEVLSRAKAIKRPVHSIYLFCTQKGTKYTYDGFQSIFYRHKKKMGLGDIHFHDLRAKATTDADSQGLNAQKLAGHKSRAMTEHYIKQRQYERVEPLKKIEQDK